jgi:GntR family transcriptional regulator
MARKPLNEYACTLAFVAVLMKKIAQPQWHDDLPIYRQLMQVLVGHILDRTYPEGEMLPSVRQLASDYDINPLTVAKVYKELSQQGFLEKWRGEGLMIKKGVRDAILKRERTKFLKEEWPLIRERMKRMGIDPRSLPDEE